MQLIPQIVWEGDFQRLHKEMYITNAFNVYNYNSVLLSATAYLTTKMSYTIILAM